MEQLFSFNSLLRRSICVTCGEVPPCPSCSDGEICQLTPLSCSSCPQTYCQKVASVSSSSSGTKSSNNTGAIVGGVIGGFFALLAALLLLWWFYIRPRQKKIFLQSHLALSQGAVPNGPDETDYEKNSPGFVPVGDHPSQYLDASPVEGQYATPDPAGLAPSLDNRNTTFSIASTSFTRSSNVIPIAYIPGVTTRANLMQALNGDGVYETHGRSSIASTDYRASTAVITAATMTAVQARPNLVDIGSNPVEDVRASQISDIQPVTFAQATPTFQKMNMMNAHSVTIGTVKGPTAAGGQSQSTPAIGLQSQYIPEEDESNTILSSDSEDDADDEIAGIGSNGFPKGLNFNNINGSNSSGSNNVVTTYPGNGNSSSSFASRASLRHSSSGGKNLTGNAPATPATSRTISGAPVTNGYPMLTIPGIPFNSSRVSQASSFISFKSALEPSSSLSQVPNTSTNTPAAARASVASSVVAGDDYITDLPIEALLYAQNEDGGHNNTSNKPEDSQASDVTSPFDDTFGI